MGRHGKGQAKLHPTRVALDGGIDETLNFGEGHDFIELSIDLGPFHPEDGAVQVDVLAAGQLGMEACSDLEKGAHPAVDASFALGRLGDARQDLQERALPGAVLPDDPQHISLVDVEIDVAQRPDGIAPIGLGAIPQAAESSSNGVTQGAIAGRHTADSVLFAQIAYGDSQVTHTMSANVRSIRRK